jgi:exopolysaccharide biosynthesis polyprenyl glycosylphosphotransferase
VSPRTPATTASLGAGLPALKAQRLVEFLALRAAPAAASGLIAGSHLASIGSGVIVFGCMLATAALVDRPTLPMHLIPGARLVLAGSAPVAGAIAAYAILTAAGGPDSFGWTIPALLGAWLLLALGAWIRVRTVDRIDARVAVLGSPGFTRALADELKAADIRGHSVVGWIGHEAPVSGDDPVSRLGSLGSIRETVLRQRIDLLVVAPPDSHSAASEAEVYERVADACLDLPVRTIGANQLYEELLGHVPLGTIDAAWFRYIMHPRFTATTAASRRAFDLAIGGILALIAVPVIAAAAIAIKLSGGGPIFFRQRRLGEHGVSFKILKLRSMRVDAEADGVARWSQSNDERVTPLGKTLRRYHVDELPQLWNVLRGEMTLVGPRPERPEIGVQLERQFTHYKRRGLVKPGLTGWAQVRCGYAGSEAGTAWKLCHDLFYVKHRSVFTDLLILVQTAFEATRDAHRVLRAPQPRFILRAWRGS